jgi:hypothetical protein
VALALLASGWGAVAAEKPLSAGHVPPLVRRLAPRGDVAPTNVLRLALGLPLRHRDALTNLLAGLYNPASSNYHRFLTPAEFTSRFGPTSEDYLAVIRYAQQQHFIITGEHPNRLLLNVAAAAADIERGFHTHLRTYQHPVEPRLFFAPDTEPSVPAEIPLLDVSGLSDLQPPRPLSQPLAGSATNGAYLGNDFRAAYAPGAPQTGAGQVMGMVQFDGYYPTDISNYESQAGLPAVPIETILLDDYDGTPTPGANSRNAEVSLDLELAVAMAPGLAKIILYDAGPNGAPNDVLNRMANDNTARQLSCSWGWTGGPSAAADQIFQQMAAQGQSFFCASGDDGAYAPGQVDDPGQTVAPADSPYITIVGGTTLATTGPGGARVSETVWNKTNGFGSSGGISSHYPLPDWQQGVATSANGGSAAARNLPDVAIVAENIMVFYASGARRAFSGTSCATPLWAAFAALANEQAAAHGLAPLGFLNPALYALGASADYTSVFHDITNGNNTSPNSPNLFFAEPGYDLCTGWGTPTTSLIYALTAPPDPLTLLSAANFSSTGLAGGPFNSPSVTILLTNSGSNELAWVAGSSAPWLTVSPTNGALEPGGPAAPVSVSLNAQANALPAGKYVATIAFTNPATSAVLSRQFTLNVNQQLIQNGGFETGNFTSWTQSGNLIYTSVTASSTFVHSGKYGVQAGPSPGLGYLSQILPTSPGQLYLLSFWVEYPLGGITNFFQVTWSGATLFAQANAAASTWTNLQYFVQSSSNTAVLQFGFRSDPAYFGLDDITLVPVTPPSFQQFASANGQLNFSIAAAPGLIYQVQFATNLSAPLWMNLGPPVTTTNTTITVSDPIGPDPTRFYRVLMRP